MQITPRDIEIFKLLNRYRYLRRTFIHALLAAPSEQGRLRHRIYSLAAAKYLSEPEQQKRSANYRYTPRVYELGPKGKQVLQEYNISLVEWKASVNEFWHQLMISDLVASVEISCKWRGLPFQTRWDVLDQKPFHLSSAHGNVRPDELFSINGTHFVLEADRGTESNITRWGEKIDKYGDVLKTRAYQTEWGVPSLIILNLFISPTKAENVRTYISDRLGKKSRSLCFLGMRSLGSYDVAPKPILSILDDAWHRAGHEPLTILSALERR
jgi:Replication-relaxation